MPCSNTISFTRTQWITDESTDGQITDTHTKPCETATWHKLWTCMPYMSVDYRSRNLWKHVKQLVRCKGLWTDEETNAGCRFLRWSEMDPGVRAGWRDRMDRSLFAMLPRRGVGGFSAEGGAWYSRSFPFVQTGSQTANKQNESTHCSINTSLKTIPSCMGLGWQGIVWICS